MAWLRSRRLLLERLPLVLITAIILWQLLWPPIKGLADQGDFNRVLAQVGLWYNTEDHEARYTNYVMVNFRYISERDPKAYLSSDLLFVQLAMLVNKLISPGGLFDIRVLGVLRAIALLAAVWIILVAGRAFDPQLRILLAVLLVLASVDIGYIAYFNSLYSEPMSLIALCTLIGIIGLLVSQRHPSVILYAACYCSCLLLITAKIQNVTLVLALAPLIYLIPRRVYPTVQRPLAITLAATMVLLAGTYYIAYPSYLKRLTLYNTFFNGLLAESPTPQQDVEWFGLDKNWARYAGTTALETPNAKSDPVFDSLFYSHVNYGNVIVFSLTHPDRMMRLADRAARNAFTMRIVYLGNFEQSSGLPPRSQSTAFSLWSSMIDELLPKAVWFVCLVVAATMAVALDIYRSRGGPPDPHRAVCAAGVGALGLMAGIQFATVVAGDTQELPKHLFLFNVLMNCSLVAIILWAIQRLRGVAPLAAWARQASQLASIVGIRSASVRT